ncbi:MAG: AbrB family transcriptional regulator [Rhodospirillales bacterium]|jgi:putative addiction module antidote|nr:AbrB/MazE/SpoVT family DNA-binding domain-containing protein [Rhodospirillaceae bacterium]MDP6427892.1 AbrB family transcriptional regulator [Rhodospirillales bacterium]MDP6644413.1 AbrB family transcriptional regulator [Rhodospirillales bacterium]MDP6841735.1 AbrB family transcriptional regulator [Rhodospirillales bacterium]|tara:strand:+ start:1030 stop:1257 length:228 start_codon:yes stop_codon:yes gene_type:complete
MPDTVTLRKIGNSLGVLLPKSELDAAGLGEGDELFLVRTPGGFRLETFDPDFEDAIRDARDYMRRHRDAFKELAK